MQYARNAISPSLASSAITGQAGVVGTLKSAWQGYVQNSARRDEQKATIAALAQLDDAALADIGLHRSQIRSAASHLDGRPSRAAR
jgi:uncharacterized protein YjiS (DUF1127 family)